MYLELQNVKLWILLCELSFLRLSKNALKTKQKKKNKTDISAVDPPKLAPNFSIFSLPTMPTVPVWLRFSLSLLIKFSTFLPFLWFHFFPSYTSRPLLLGPWFLFSYSYSYSYTHVKGQLVCLGVIWDCKIMTGLIFPSSLVLMVHILHHLIKYRLKCAFGPPIFIKKKFWSPYFKNQFFRPIFIFFFFWILVPNLFFGSFFMMWPIHLWRDVPY